MTDSDNQQRRRDTNRLNKNLYRAATYTSISGGNIIQGVSRALMEEVKFDSTGIKTLDWSTYPVIRFPDVPEIEIVLINRPEMPALGGGEPSSAPIAAAIANAIFDATGVRLREAPFTPERVLAGLKKT